MLRVQVDPQERILAAEFVREGVTPEVASLRRSGGDIAVTTKHYDMGVEVKSTPDLLASWAGRRMKCKTDCPLCHGKGCQRLTSQLVRMLNNYDVAVLLVWGWFGMDPQGYVLTPRNSHRLWDGLWNALAAWEHQGVLVQLATDRRHVVHRVLSLASFIERKPKVFLPAEQVDDSSDGSLRA